MDINEYMTDLGRRARKASLADPWRADKAVIHQSAGRPR